MPDFAALAQAYGAHGEVVGRIIRAIDDWLAK